MARRKKAQPKLKKVNVSKKAQWNEILKDIDKDEIPIDLLQAMNVNLIDGTQVYINIKELLLAGNSPDEIEAMLDIKLKAIDQYIEDIDFYVNVDDVAKTVQPITDQMLKDL
jgi:hypothetical protein